MVEKEAEPPAGSGRGLPRPTPWCLRHSRCMSQGGGGKCTSWPHLPLFGFSCDHHLPCMSHGTRAGARGLWHWHVDHREAGERGPEAGTGNTVGLPSRSTGGYKHHSRAHSGLVASAATSLHQRSGAQPLLGALKGH